MFKHRNKRERGQSLVEMAISLPVLILILSGLLDLGRMYYTAIALEESVAEAALYLAIDPRCTDPSVTAAVGDPCHDPNNAIYRATHSGGSQEVNWSQAKWNIPAIQASGMTDAFDCPGFGCKVTIQLYYTYDFITPGIEAIANGVTGGNGLVLKFQATQIIVFQQ